MPWEASPLEGGFQGAWPEPGAEAQPFNSQDTLLQPRGGEGDSTWGQGGQLLPHRLYPKPKDGVPEMQESFAQRTSQPAGTLLDRSPPSALQAALGASGCSGGMGSSPLSDDRRPGQAKEGKPRAVLGAASFRALSRPSWEEADAPCSSCPLQGLVPGPGSLGKLGPSLRHPGPTSPFPPGTEHPPEGQPSWNSPPAGTPRPAPGPSLNSPASLHLGDPCTPSSHPCCDVTQHGVTWCDVPGVTGCNVV